ncbi:hypothetical protein Tco_1284187 [Tanacetum coccineum]
MTGNISYLLEYEPFNGGYVSFGHGRGKITGKGSIKTCKLDFENVYFVEELKYNLFSVSQICDNKNSVLFTDSECIMLGKDFKLVDDKHVLLRTPRQENMYSIDLKNIIPHKNLTCLIAKVFEDETMLWHRRLGHLNFKTMTKLVRNNLVKVLSPKSFENNHTCVACLKGKQHKAFSKSKSVNSISKPLHTLHTDLFGPTSVSSLNHKWYCLVVTDDFSRFTWTFFLKSKDETFGILRNFITEIENLKDLKVKIIRCDNGGERRNRTLIEAARTMLADAKLPVTFWAEAVNTACKFDAKGDEGYFVGYSLSSKAFRVFNKRTKKVDENLHVDFLENQPIEKGTGPNWLFDIDTLTKSMNYIPVVDAGTSSTNISDIKEAVHQGVKEKESPLRFIDLLNWFHKTQMTTSKEAAKKDDAILDKNTPQKEQVKVYGNNEVTEEEQEEVNGDNEISESSGIAIPTASAKDSSKDLFELVSSSTVETKVPTISSPVPTDNIPIPQVTSSAPRIISRGGSGYSEPLSLGNAMSFENRLEDFFGDTTNAVRVNEVESDLSNMETAIQVSPTPTLIIHKDHRKKEPKKISKALKDPSWVEAMQEELLQFKIQNVWVLVDCPKGVRPIGTKWVLKNKRDKRGIVIRNKARLVAQGHTQEEGIDYEEVFTQIARIKAIRLFLAYASYMGFTVYQMDVKCAFLYGTIDEEVKHKGKFLLVQVYVDDIIFGSSNPKLCREFEALMHDKFKMSAIGKLSFFLGLQVLQKKDGIFLSQDKYVGDILKKFGFSDLKSANTPMDRENP